MGTFPSTTGGASLRPRPATVQTARKTSTQAAEAIARSGKGLERSAKDAISRGKKSDSSLALILWGALPACLLMWGAGWSVSEVRTGTAYAYFI